MADYIFEYDSEIDFGVNGIVDYDFSDNSIEEMEENDEKLKEDNNEETKEEIIQSKKINFVFLNISLKKFCPK